MHASPENFFDYTRDDLRAWAVRHGFSPVHALRLWSYVYVERCEDWTRMPDLRGLSAREAIKTLTSLGVTASLSGQGVVVAQNPEPGAPFESGDSCRLQLGRRPVASQAGHTQP